MFKNLQGAGGACSPACGNAVKGRTAQDDRPGAQRQRLDDVRAAPEAAVGQQCQAVADGICDSFEGMQGWDRAIQLPSAVVRHHDAVGANEDGFACIGDREHALDEKGAFPHGAYVGDILPGKIRMPVLAGEFGDFVNAGVRVNELKQIFEARHTFQPYAA